MYIPKPFAQTDDAALWQLVDEHAFGTLLTVVDEQPFLSHVPFLCDRATATLHCHLARANPQWQQVAAARSVLAVFRGPHGYISPTWYSSPNLPTWNYAVVHVHGEARIVDEPEHARRHVEALAAKFERQLPEPWTPDYDLRRLTGIVGVEIRVRKLEGKFKLGQNRSAADRDGVVAALMATGRDNDAELARLMAAGTSEV